MSSGFCRTAQRRRPRAGNIWDAQNGGPAISRGTADVEQGLLERALIAYQDLTSSGSGTVSLTISHRSCRHTRLSALASACRKTIKLSGWYATTKSSPSRLIDTCLRKRALFRNASTESSTDITRPHIFLKPHQNYLASGEAHWPVLRTDRGGGKRRDKV